MLSERPCLSQPFLCCHGDSQLKIVQAQVKASMCADTGNAPAGLEPVIGSTAPPRMGCSLLSGECSTSTESCGDFQMEIEVGLVHPVGRLSAGRGGPDYGDSLFLQPPCLPLTPPCLPLPPCTPHLVQLLPQSHPSH